MTYYILFYFSESGVIQLRVEVHRNADSQPELVECSEAPMDKDNADPQTVKHMVKLPDPDPKPEGVQRPEPPMDQDKADVPVPPLQDFEDFKVEEEGKYMYMYILNQLYKYRTKSKHFIFIKTVPNHFVSTKSV